jgi:hypothetical protein
VFVLAGLIQAGVVRTASCGDDRSFAEAAGETGVEDFMRHNCEHLQVGVSW